MTMREYVGCHRVATPVDLMELALGTPPELWLGVEGETRQERAARQAAARDILTDDPAMAERTARLAAKAVAAHLPELLRLAATVADIQRHHVQAEAAA